VAGGLFSGSGRVNVRGSYALDVTTSLRFAGTRTVEDLTATWSTVIVLERVRTHR
jgi:hypothetical protein